MPASITWLTRSPTLPLVAASVPCRLQTRSIAGMRRPAPSNARELFCTVFPLLTLAAMWPTRAKDVRVRASLVGRVARRQLVAACIALFPTVARAGPDVGKNLLYSGMETFTIADSKAKVQESVTLFDKAASSGYPANRLWQRGLSLYYADRFMEGAKQFRDDVALNPNDTEESIWAMLCEARILGFEEARRQMITIAGERRPYMRAIYDLFRGGEREAKSLSVLQKMTAGSGADQFYAALYLGLFAEAKGDTEAARREIQKSVATTYAKSSGDYMAALARVHVAVRGWNKSDL